MKEVDTVTTKDGTSALLTVVEKGKRLLFSSMVGSDSVIPAFRRTKDVNIKYGMRKICGAWPGTLEENCKRIKTVSSEISKEHGLKGVSSEVQKTCLNDFPVNEKAVDVLQR